MGAANTILIVVLLSPLLALVVRSVTLGEGPPSLRYYQALTENRSQSIFFVRPIEAIRNSLLFSFAAVALSLLLGLIAAYLLAGSNRQQSRLVRWLDPVFLLPLGTSAVTLGLGYIIALDEPPLNLRASLWLIPLAYTLIAMPFVVRSLLPALRSLSPRLRESAAVMGASPARVIREVDLPIIGRALAVAAVFAFTISLGEFGATLLLYQPKYPTMSVITTCPGPARSAQLRPGIGHEHGADGGVPGGLLVIERLRVGEIGEF